MRTEKQEIEYLLNLMEDAAVKALIRLILHKIELLDILVKGS